MKTKFYSLSIITALTILTIPVMSSGGSAADKEKSRILVAYFSRTGSTREIAMQIKNITGGDIFEIRAVNLYPSDYEEAKKIAMNELNSGSKPPLKNKINIKSYDVIFIGYPIWWGTFPAPVRTFLSENDFSGKSIVPFSTHLGSELGISVKDIKKLAPGAKISEGISVWGNDTKNARYKITQWLQKLDIAK